MTFPITSKPTPRTVFDLDASDLVHCEEETGAYAQFIFYPYKFFFFIQSFKVYLSKKIHAFQKILENVLFFI